MKRTALLPWLLWSVVLVAVVVVWAVALQALGDSDGGDDPNTGGPPATGTPASCEGGVHEGHNLMSWDPTMADEMLDRGCGWPYEPFVSSGAGGREDPTLAAPFEPRRYAELWDLLGRADVGVCSVSSLPDPPADGFAFGFRYAVAEPGCPGAAATVDLVAREYVGRGPRDAAAHAVDDGARAFVLGRWALSLSDGDLAEAVAEELLDLGASEVTG